MLQTETMVQAKMHGYAGQVTENKLHKAQPKAAILG